MSEPKKYSLKAIETQLLTVTQQQFQSMMSNQMAMIAIERLNYDVTPQTRFEFNPEMTEVSISELESEPVAEDVGVVGE